MPVMKEYAFIVLFACDYVNPRNTAVWGSCRELPCLRLGAMGNREQGLLLRDRAKFLPRCKEFIFCRLAKTFDSLNTRCWKKSWAESLLYFPLLFLRLTSHCGIVCIGTPCLAEALNLL